MIKLFRNLPRRQAGIRQNLLQSGKLKSYTVYALGEIFLVVIGILMALQINNWNEQRKSKKFEQEILHLIDQNLERDSVLLSIELGKAKEAIEMTDKLMEQVALKNYNDSLNNWMGKIISFERFKSQSSAFEVLKSKGFESITDNRLQIELISYYDESLFKLYESLTDLLNSFNNDWIPVVKQEFSDFKWTEYCTPLDSEKFFQKPSSIVLFKLYKDNRAGFVRKAGYSLEKISEIRGLIKNNLHD
jgi:hypothetical protein